jgi:hypothetical protein
MSRALTQFKQREGIVTSSWNIEYLDHGGANSTNSILGLVGIPTHFTGAWKTGCEAELLESLGVKWIVNFQEDWTGTSICCWYSRSEKGTCGCQRNTKKVALIILERGWRINGCYIGLGVSGGSAEVARGSRGCHVGKQKDQSLIMMHKTKELALGGRAHRSTHTTYSIEHTGERKFVAATSRRSGPSLKFSSAERQRRWHLLESSSLFFESSSCCA